MNNIELDNDESVTNYKYCEQRSAQYIRAYFDSSYIVHPSFWEWEMELYPVSKKHYSK